MSLITLFSVRNTDRYSYNYIGGIARKEDLDFPNPILYISWSVVVSEVIPASLFPNAPTTETLQLYR